MVRATAIAPVPINDWSQTEPSHWGHLSLPPVGSVYETFGFGGFSNGWPVGGRLDDNFNFSNGNGFEVVYSDTVGTAATGGNTITETLVTPLGDINIPTFFDAAAYLNPADFPYLF
jgi:hypothetical protein